MADLRSGAHPHAAVEVAVSSIETALPKTWLGWRMVVLWHENNH